jgi:DNA repair protein RadD
MLLLRQYQEDALRALFTFWQNGGGNPLLVLATGTGKSICIAFLIKRLLTDYPKMRVLVTAPNRELIDQDIKELLKVWPEAPIGINCEGLDSRDTDAQILFATVNSLYRNPKAIGRRELWIIDEAHFIPDHDEGMYRVTLEGLRELVPHVRVAGLTGTPYRLDSGHLCEGEGRLFDSVVYTYGIAEGITDGVLAPLSSKATTASIDVSGVGKRGGEFIADQLEAAAIHGDVVDRACDEIASYRGQRHAWLVYCVGVTHAGLVRDALRARGIDCETVLGETPSEERDRIIEDFRAGRLTCLISVMVLSYGFNVPHVDLIGMLRPTCSAGLYVQQVGRGARKAEGKTDCLVLDFAGNVRRFGPVDVVRIRNKNSKQDDEAPPTKTCPDCQVIVALGATKCSCCGHVFPRETKPRHAAFSDTASILSPPRVVSDWLEVEDIQYRFHHKETPSLRVTFQCGLQDFHKWVCLQHSGYARAQAERFWRALSDGVSVPRTVDEALQRQNELAWVSHIRVAPRGERYWDIIGYRIDGENYDGNLCRLPAWTKPDINDSIPY